MPESDVRPVTGFRDRGHPQFRTRVVLKGEGGDFSWQRMRMEESLREANGLIFPHDAHLKKEGVEGPDGKERLACSDCHRSGSEGVAMEPVRFERDCQRCHELNFEPTDPGRQAPHGDPEAVVSMLEEYYARVALAGGYRREEAEPPTVVRRERPSARELDEPERRTALSWASRQADKVATELIANRTCKLCHSVERNESAPSGWRIGPVAMTQDWFPRAEFTHAAHQRMSCTDCHQAQASGKSSDVLMPKIGTCRECHGEPGSQASQATRCVDCHSFHAADRLRMGFSSGEVDEDAPE